MSEDLYLSPHSDLNDEQRSRGLSKDNTSLGLNLEDMMDPNISENGIERPGSKECSEQKPDEQQDDSNDGSGSEDDDNEDEGDEGKNGSTEIYDPYVLFNRNRP